jgi:hypothetical protein
MRGVSVLGVGLLFLLTACGGSEPAPKAEAPKEPELINVTVVLQDSKPLDILFNADDQECTSRNIEQVLENAMSGGEAESDPVEVALRDADGSLIGTITLPEHGGTVGPTGCEWEVAFPEVPKSNFYEATVTGFQAEENGTGEVSADTRVLVTF